MENEVKKLMLRYQGKKARQVAPLGGGFYGRVFLADGIGTQPVVVKLYLFPGMAKREDLQLRTLSHHAALRMPKVGCVHTADDEIPYDALIMEYLPGVNAGECPELPLKTRERIGDEIISNLLAFHDTVNPRGFGELDGTAFTADWRDFYRTKASLTWEKTRELYTKGKINSYIYETTGKAASNFDRIFYLPIQTARLVHGDYNTWNILLDEACSHAAAVIDPCNCCWADAEMELYQLDNANGKAFRLLEKYRERRGLSENFALKNSFYQVFSELAHYYDSKVDPYLTLLTGQVRALEDAMRAAALL